MEEQNNLQSMQPVRTKKPVKLLGLILLAILILCGACYGIYAWQQSKVQSLETQVSSLEQSNEKTKAQLKESENALDQKSDAGQKNQVTDLSMVDAAVQSACSITLFKCSSVKIVKQTDKYIAASVVASSENARTDGMQAPKSVLLKKTTGGSWQWVISSPNTELCGLGTDQPDLVTFCRG